MTFEPEKHFRKLKGQDYLEVKWRIVWFRNEHPDGYIKTEQVHADYAGGHFAFKAQAGYFLRIEGALDADGFPVFREVYACGYGSETVKDFADASEKAETKAVGRALAHLGYGTAQAEELDEGIDESKGTGALADSPVDGRTAQNQATHRTAQQGQTTRQTGGHAAPGSGGQGRAPLTVVPQPATIDELRAQVETGLAQDAEAASKLPKGPRAMNESELTKTLAWLNRRSRALSS